MKDLLDKRHKEFEEKFGITFGEDDINHQILSFHDQTVLMVLRKAVDIINNEVPQPEEWLEWTNEERRRYLQGGRAVRVLLTSSIEELQANK